jgi:aryl-alcohol dehydrogenase-like predicted oxidoreductase
MQTRQLGSTDLHITTIGLGTWALGGTGWFASWGPQDDNDSIATIHKALDLGLNWIDTAAVYGLGHAEEIVGRALKGRSERPFLFTKCSRKGTPDGKVEAVLKADSIRQEVEDSLCRLQVATIDLYQIHWPMPDEDIEEGWRTMAELIAAGKVRYIGVSNFNVNQLRRAQAIAPVSSLQPPYSLINRAVENEILPFCQQHNIGVIVYSPLASGLLTGAMTPARILSLPESDWRLRNPEFREPRLSRNMALVTLLHDIGKRHDKTPGEVALAWTLRHPAITAAIVGGRRPEQLEEVMGAAEFRLNAEELQEIDTFIKTHP